MALDPNIILSGKLPEFQNPLAQLAQVSQIQQAQNTNALAQYKLASAQREDADSNAIRNILRNAGGDMDAGQNALMKGGYYKQALEFGKVKLEQDKSKSEIAKNTATAGKTNYEVSSQKRDKAVSDISALNSPADALASLDAHEKTGELDPAHAQAIRSMLQAIPGDDPAAFGKWQIRMIRSIMTPKEQMGYLAPDANAQLQTQTSMRNTDANNATSRANNAATNATTMRGQNMTDARSKDANGKGQYDAERGVLVDQRTGVARPVTDAAGVPIAPKDKPLTESQGKATGFTARMENADKTINDMIAAGTKTPSLLKQSAESVPLIGAGLGMAANNFASPNQQKMEQAQRDFVNAVLRQESGASISASEFDSARKQYFPQPGDSAAVIAQKTQNRRIAIEGMKAQAGQGAKSIPGILNAVSQPALPAGWTIKEVK
jgi:hypothetical protein